MRHILLAAAAALALLGSADAATLTLPSVTVTSSTSTSIACNATAGSYAAPLAAGTVVFNCTVAPAGWTGAISLAGGGQFVTTGLSGTSFSVAVGGAALAAGTYAPGVLTSTP